VDLRKGSSLPCTYNVPRTTCDGLLCATCENAKATRHSASIQGTYTASPAKVLSSDDLQPGDCFSYVIIIYHQCLVGLFPTLAIAHRAMDILVVPFLLIMLVR
jgi:hypothetical protein